MDDFYIIFRHELKSLAKSAKSTILSLVLVSLFWGLFLSYNMLEFQKSIIWIIISAFVASSGFANVSFARERLAGSWEILLASGISRKTIFWAKLAFTQTATFFCGMITLTVAYAVMYIDLLFAPYYDLIFIDALLFFCTALSINVLTAYFTIINVNMRAAQLINMSVISVCIMAVHYVCDMDEGAYAFELWTDWAKIIIIMLIPAIPFLFLCPRALYDDKTTLPIVY